MKKKQGNAILISSKLEGLGLFACSHCGKETLTSKESVFCPHCYSDLPEKQSVSAAMTASDKIKLQSPVVKCDTCDSDIYSDSKESAEALANSIYCPVCGSAEISTCGDEVESETEEIEEDIEEDVKDKIADVPEVDEELESSESEDDAADLQEDLEDEASDVDDAVDHLKDEIEDISDKNEDLEASLISNPEPTWFFFKAGMPVFKIAKSEVDSSVHSIFATDSFVDIFTKRMAESTLTSTIKEFGGTILSKQEALNANDIESIAFEKLQSSIMPKFLDCLTLAIEGASKGVYKNLNADLKASFYDELVACGIADKKASNAIEAAFASAGTDVFTSLISKATELMYKDDSAFTSIKATIQESGIVQSNNVTEETIDHKEFKAKLISGNVILDAKSSDNSVSSMRSRISFKN